MAIGKWKGCCNRLGEIKNSTLVITGADDILIPPQNANYLAGKIPGAQMTLRPFALRRRPGLRAPL